MWPHWRKDRLFAGPKKAGPLLVLLWLRMWQGVWAIFSHKWLITFLFRNSKANCCPTTCIRATVTPNRSLFGKPPGTSLNHLDKETAWMNGFTTVPEYQWYSGKTKTSYATSQIRPPLACPKSSPITKVPLYTRKMNVAYLIDRIILNI